jgi:hypothetical protein
MFRLLALATALGIPQPLVAATLPLDGSVTVLGAGSNIAVGDPLSGTITFDTTDGGCPDFCSVTALSLDLPSAITVSLLDEITPATVNVDPSPTLDGWFLLPSGAYGFTDAELVVGAFAAGSGSFELWGDGFTTLIAGGDLQVVPLPATLPLLAAGLGALAWARRCRTAT